MVLASNVKMLSTVVSSEIMLLLSAVLSPGKMVFGVSVRPSFVPAAEILSCVLYSGDVLCADVVT